MVEEKRPIVRLELCNDYVDPVYIYAYRNEDGTIEEISDAEGAGLWEPDNAGTVEGKGVVEGNSCMLPGTAINLDALFLEMMATVEKRNEAQKSYENLDNHFNYLEDALWSAALNEIVELGAVIVTELDGPILYELTTKGRRLLYSLQTASALAFKMTGDDIPF